jgi:hypothetical protein
MKNSEVKSINEPNQSVSNSKLVKLKEQLEEKVILRSNFFDMIEDYIGFFIIKLTGLGLWIISIFEYFKPDFLLIEIKNPEITFGIGIALLLNKVLLGRLIRLIKILNKLDDDNSQIPDNNNTANK